MPFSPHFAIQHPNILLYILSDAFTHLCLCVYFQMSTTANEMERKYSGCFFLCLQFYKVNGNTQRLRASQCVRFTLFLFIVMVDDQQRKIREMIRLRVSGLYLAFVYECFRQAKPISGFRDEKFQIQMDQLIFLTRKNIFSHATMNGFLMMKFTPKGIELNVWVCENSICENCLQVVELVNAAYKQIEWNAESHSLVELLWK